MNAVKNVQKMMEQLGNQIDGQGGEVNQLHYGTQGAAASFFQQDRDIGLSEAAVRRALDNNRLQRLGRLPNQLPATYKRCGLDFNRFLQLGMRERGGAGFRKFFDPAARSLGEVSRALGINETSLEDGGFLVLPEFSPKLLELAYADSNLWSRVPEYTVNGSMMTFPREAPDRTDGKRNGGFRGYWTGENKEITDSDAHFETTDLKLGKLCVAIFVTEEMINDTGGVMEQWITRHGSKEFSFQLGNALLNGVGGFQPLGYLKSGHRVTVAKESGQAKETIVADNILKMWARRLSAGAEDDLVWTINQNCETQLPKMTLATGSASGQLIYMPPGGVSGTPYATLQGRPIIPTEYNPVLGKEGDIALLNFAQYIGIAKGGITQTSSAHVEFLRDLNCIKFTMRVNGRPIFDEPVKPYQSNGADYQSGCIVLAERA